MTRAAEIEAGVEKLLSEGLGHGLSPSKSSPAPTGMTSSYGGAASSAATANAQLAQPTYMPEFVGGVGGGANDPAYEMPVTPTTTGSSPSDGRTAVSHESTGAGPSGYQVVGKGGLSSPIGTHGAAGTSKEDTHTVRRLQAPSLNRRLKEVLCLLATRGYVGWPLSSTHFHARR